MRINLVLLLPDTDSGATASLEIQNHSGVLLEPPMNVLVSSRRRLALTGPGKSSLDGIMGHLLNWRLMALAGGTFTIRAAPA